MFLKTWNQMLKKIHQKKEIYATNSTTKFEIKNNQMLFLPCRHVRECDVQETIHQDQKEV